MLRADKLKNDLDRVSDRISDADEKLANIFDRLLRGALEKEIQNSIKKEENLSDEGERELDEERIRERIKKDARSKGNVNCYPCENKGGCHEICIGFAFGKYLARAGDSLGFVNVAEKLKQHWNLCEEETKRTLFLTSSWDEVKFNEDHKEDFDKLNRSSDKTVAIVLVTPMGLSLQYLV